MKLGGRAQTRLWVIAKLVVEALPGALVWVCNGDVVCIRQGLHALPHQRDAALEQWQDCVAKVKALLHAALQVSELPSHSPATQCYCKSTIPISMCLPLDLLQHKKIQETAEFPLLPRHSLPL